MSASALLFAVISPGIYGVPSYLIRDIIKRIIRPLLFTCTHIDFLAARGCPPAAFARQDPRSVWRGGEQLAGGSRRMGVSPLLVMCSMWPAWLVCVLTVNTLSLRLLITFLCADFQQQISLSIQFLKKVPVCVCARVCSLSTLSVLTKTNGGKNNGAHFLHCAQIMCTFQKDRERTNETQQQHRSQALPGGPGQLLREMTVWITTSPRPRSHMGRPTRSTGMGLPYDPRSCTRSLPQNRPTQLLHLRALHSPWTSRLSRLKATVFS